MFVWCSKLSILSLYFVNPALSTLATAGSPKIQSLWLYFSPLTRNDIQQLTANIICLVIMGTDQAIGLRPDLETLSNQVFIPSLLDYVKGIAHYFGGEVRSVDAVNLIICLDCTSESHFRKIPLVLILRM